MRRASSRCAQDELNNNEKLRHAMATGAYMALAESLATLSAECFPRDFPRQWDESRNFRPDLITSCTMQYPCACAIAQALRVPCVLCDLSPLSVLPISKYNQTEVRASGTTVKGISAEAP